MFRNSFIKNFKLDGGSIFKEKVPNVNNKTIEILTINPRRSLRVIDDRSFRDLIYL